MLFIPNSSLPPRWWKRVLKKPNDWHTLLIYFSRHCKIFIKKHHSSLNSNHIGVKYSCFWWKSATRRGLFNPPPPPPMPHILRGLTIDPHDLSCFDIITAFIDLLWMDKQVFNHNQSYATVYTNSVELYRYYIWVIKSLRKKNYFPKCLYFQILIWKKS